MAKPKDTHFAIRVNDYKGDPNNLADYLQLILTAVLIRESDGVSVERIRRVGRGFQTIKRGESECSTQTQPS